LNFTQLQVLLDEIAQLINNRPLAEVSQSFEDCSAVSPNEILFGKRLDMLPDGRSSTGHQINKSTFVEKLRLRRRLLTYYWSEFRKSYLASLAPERRWRNEDTKQNPAIKLGELVQINDPGYVARGTWKLGRVHKLIPGEDSIVRKVVLRVPNVDNSRKPHFLTRSIRQIAPLEGAFNN